jgi:heptosyltransferase-2
LQGGLKPRMQVSAAALDAAAARAGLAPGQALVVFAPGAEFGAAKRWPAAHFAALAHAILDAHPGVKIVMLGSPKDQAAGEEVRQLADSASVVNLAGATRLEVAIALIARADAVIANDSGLLHIASALNRPVVALYGPTDPDHAPPFSDLAASISLRLACAPCKQRECPLGHHDCMKQLAPALAWQALRPMLVK